MIKWSKSRISRFLETAPAGRALFLADGVLIRLARWTARNAGQLRPVETLVIAAPGRGNIGDQALLEAALDNSTGSVLVLVKDNEDFTLPPRYRDRVTVAESRHLLYGDPVRRAVDYLRFLAHARSAKKVWLIGADTMDGAYNALASVTRYSAVYGAAAMGAQTRVLGFSWNDHATASAAWWARRCTSTVELWARDPVSLERLASDGAVGVRLCADIVFARDCTVAADSEASVWIESQREGGRNVAVVNCSGLIGSDATKLAQYRYLVDWLEANSWSIVFVPHVIRPGNDDLALIREVVHGSGEHRLVIERLLSPDAIFSLVSQVDVVVTGRMHLAVLSVLSGIIPITLATQGKVEGLYRMLACENLCIEPNADFGTKITDIWDEMLAVNQTFDRESPLLNDVRNLAKLGLGQLEPTSVLETR
ncbi:polysaccharide pyruvyl transferase family protein [Rhodococcus sp. ARC_M6]|uniref:polysaccharide pyruvyl transferase family protein n=1 Tax=Rhodococcus sp. ARC_M6 TaxID=2928852 RepID=UPI001FB43CF2|nr:polysaccharide pyruvyl transferase family protein [Rhodococcus sp. ARC_M6]MCJ0902134.1 polysaccharide pyruvyl transferase family protein [Rhodococcus sp. ARC_M6]